MEEQLWNLFEPQFEAYYKKGANKRGRHEHMANDLPFACTATQVIQLK